MSVKLEETTAAVAALKDTIVLQQQNYKLIDQKLSTLANVRAQNQSQSQNSAYNTRPVYCCRPSKIAQWLEHPKRWPTHEADHRRAE